MKGHNEILKVVGTGRAQVITTFIAMVSTLIGAFVAFSSLLDLRLISRVFEELGGLSDIAKPFIALLLGVLATIFSMRSLAVKELSFRERSRVKKENKTLPVDR